MTQHSKPRNVETATQLRRITGVLLTTILEVIDGRRPFKQIQTITTGAANGLVYDLVQQRTGTATSTARVRAVHIQLNTPPTTAEFFGTFTRGGRSHAIAGTIAEAQPGIWQVTDLTIG